MREGQPHRGKLRARAGFQNGGKHLGSSEVVALRGAAVEADLRPVRQGGWESLAPPTERIGDTGARGNANEEGSSPPASAFARVPSAHAAR
jgi:hypothetical protein